MTRTSGKGQLKSLTVRGELEILLLELINRNTINRLEKVHGIAITFVRSTSRARVDGHIKVAATRRLNILKIDMMPSEKHTHTN